MGALKVVTGAVGGLAGLRQMSVGVLDEGWREKEVEEGEGGVWVSRGEVSA